MGDIGPGPLMCIQSTMCDGCGSGVKQGRLYQCIGLRNLSIFEIILHPPCACGNEHPYVLLAGHDHMYCPGLFAPLGDPDAVIKETDEPHDTKRVEDDCYDLPPVKETENV